MLSRVNFNNLSSTRVYSIHPLIDDFPKQI
jgi:hypothetical protein